MPAIPVVFKRFDGGWSTGNKLGLANSQAYTEALDFRKNPSQLTVLPKLGKESASVVTDLVTNAVMVTDGSIYSIGDSGNFYKRTTAGSWSLIGSASATSHGLSYRPDSDYIYIPGTVSVSTYGPLSGTPSLSTAYYNTSVSTYDNTATAGFNVDTNQSGSGSTTALATSIAETAVARRFFQLDIEPLTTISIYVVAKGTGNWTVTLHDGLNNALASKTIANGSLSNGAFNNFTFTTPVRLHVKPNARTYHFHVTSTQTDGTVASSSSNDLATCDLQLYADRLVNPTNGLHPMVRFQQFECIGNANYLSVWEPISEPPTNSEWLRHRLSFPQGYEVCGLAVFNEYLAIALEKVSTSSTSIPQQGLIAWWDGLTDSNDIHPNYFTEIPEGAPYGLTTYKNNIYYYAGGVWWRIASPASQPEKIFTFPGSDTEYSGATAPIKIYPNAGAVRRGVLLTAYPSETTDTSINYGVYSWGAVDSKFPESFGYSYIISPGTKNYSAANNLKIGMVRSFGDILLVSWREDDASGDFGVDSVTNASAPATSSSWQSIIMDDGFTSKVKKALYIECTFTTLPSGASFVLKYKIDRGSWTSSSSLSSTSFTNERNIARFDINQVFTEIQIGLDVTSGSTTPTFTSISLVYDNTQDEGLR